MTYTFHCNQQLRALFSQSYCLTSGKDAMLQDEGEPCSHWKIVIDDLKEYNCHCSICGRKFTGNELVKRIEEGVK